jgi:hypothetical protein
MNDLLNRGIQRATAGSSAPGQTVLSFSSSGGLTITSGGSVALHVPAAGKNFYVTDLDCSTDSTAAVLVQLQAGNTIIGEKYISTTCPWEMVGIETQMMCPGGQLLEVTFAAGTTHAAYVINGYEQ